MLRNILLSFMFLALTITSASATGPLREKLRERMQQHKAGMQTWRASTSLTGFLTI